MRPYALATARALLEADNPNDPYGTDVKDELLDIHTRPLEAKGFSIEGTYRNFEGMLKGRSSRKVGNNTYIERLDGNKIGIKLHRTYVIVVYPDDKVMVDTGGWMTVTTKDRINTYLPPGYSLYQQKSDWWWSVQGFNAADPQTQILLPFNSGDTITGDGYLILQEPPLFKKLRKPRAEY